MVQDTTRIDMEMFEKARNTTSVPPSMNSQNLVGGLEHFLFSHILGCSSSQLTNSYFSEGWPNHQPATVQGATRWLCHMFHSRLLLQGMERKHRIHIPWKQGWYKAVPHLQRSVGFELAQVGFVLDSARHDKSIYIYIHISYIYIYIYTCVSYILYIYTYHIYHISILRWHLWKQGKHGSRSNVEEETCRDFSSRRSSQQISTDGNPRQYGYSLGREISSGLLMVSRVSIEKATP